MAVFNKLWPTGCLSLLLVAIVLFTYRDAGDVTFVFDDGPNISEHLPVQITELTFTALADAVVFGKIKSRALANLSFAIDWWRGGGASLSFVQTNVVIHILTSFAVWHLLYLLLAYGYRDYSRRLLLVAGFAGACIWAVHPMQIQSVIYIVQRMNSLAALFSVLTLVCYHRYRTSNSVTNLVWAGVFLTLGMLSKENAIVTVPLIVAMEYGLYRHSVSRIRYFDEIVIACVAGGVAYGLFDLFTQGPFTTRLDRSYAGKDFTLAERLLTQPRVVLSYYGQFFLPWPDRFSIEHDVIYSTSLIKPVTTLISMITLLVIGAVGVKLIRSKSFQLVGLFIVWPLVALSVESGFLPLEMVFEHRFYLPSVGICGLVAIGLLHASTALGRRGIYMVSSIPVCIVVIISISTHSRIQDWRSPLILYEKALVHAPDSGRLWNNVGSIYASNGDVDKAFRILNKAAQVEPAYSLTWYNLAKLKSERLDRQYAALDDIEKALELERDNPEYYLMMGNILLALRNFSASITAYDEALELAPYYFVARNNRGLANLRSGRVNDSIADFKAALYMRSNYPDAQANLGTAYLLGGDVDNAVRVLEQVVQEFPYRAVAHYNLARAYVLKRRPDRSRSHYDSSCALGLAKACAAAK